MSLCRCGLGDRCVETVLSFTWRCGVNSFENGVTSAIEVILDRCGAVPFTVSIAAFSLFGSLLYWRYLEWRYMDQPFWAWKEVPYDSRQC